MAETSDWAAGWASGADRGSAPRFGGGGTAQPSVATASAVLGADAPAERGYLLIGDGRLARHLLHYLSLIHEAEPRLARKYQVEQWSRRSGGRPEALAELAARADTVLLAIRDDAIEPFVREHPALAGKRLVHFSGALTTSLASGQHPLMTFGPELYELSLYERIPFVGEQGREPFREVFPFLRNPAFSIPTSERPFYHALCVLGGNFTVLLWQKLVGELQARYDIPKEAAWPYLSQVVASLMRDPESALTGPFQRRDMVTIERNLCALEGDRFRPVYEAFVNACLDREAAEPSSRSAGRRAADSAPERGRPEAARPDQATPDALEVTRP